MKILFFTTLDPDSRLGSAIQNAGDELVRQGHRLRLVATDATPVAGANLRRQFDPVPHWTNTTAVREAMRESDLVVYHIGQRFDCWRGSVEWLAKEPGVVCLHDADLEPGFDAWARGLSSLEQPVRRAVDATNASADARSWLFRNSLAVLLGSSHDAARATELCSGPVQIQPLAPSREPSSRLRQPHTDQLSVVVASESPDSAAARQVLRTLAKSPAHSRMNVRLIEPSAEDVRIVPPTDVVVVIGTPRSWMSFASVKAALDEAAVVVALTEATAGFFGRGVVRVADPTDESLASAIESALVETARRRIDEAVLTNEERGVNPASDWVAALMELWNNVQRVAPARRLVERIAQQLAAWGLTESGAYDEFIFEPLLLGGVRTVSGHPVEHAVNRGA